MNKLCSVYTKLQPTRCNVSWSTYF